MPDEKASAETSARRHAYRRTPRGRYHMYTNNAKIRGIRFDITFEDFLTFWQNDCEYCGDKIPLVGLDWIDSSLGYSLDNIVSCCSVCNKIKMDLDLDNLNNHMLKMLKHQGVI